MAGVYVHIPFCKRKCIYCDFYSIASSRLSDRYVKAVGMEAQLRGQEIAGMPVKTLYIGGGTPSVLSFEQLSVLIEGLRAAVDLSHVEEFTVEVNPDDVTHEFAEQLLKLGVNRVSMGVQSLVDEELVFLNRRHDAKEAMKAYCDLQSAGFNNISIDLIYGIPGQTLDTWKYTLEKALSLQAKHVSCYNLSYEEGTMLHKLRETGRVMECDDNTCVEMYDMLVDMLDGAGYEHYEISNFAMPGFYSRHNSGYWDKTPYLGLGASAHSYDGNMRRYNPDNVKLYVESLENDVVVCVGEQESVDEKYDEDVMLRLRTSRGIDSEWIKSIYGKAYSDYFVNAIRSFVDSGLVIKDGSRYRLSRNGVMLSDMIMRELMRG